MVATPTPSGAAAPSTPASQLKIVGGPVAAEGAAVIITVDAKHDLHLDGIAPNTGKVIWTHPYSESAITPGLSPTVYALGNNVIDIVPAGAPSSPLVNIDGINATTGAIAWKGLKDIVVSDQPGPCAAKKDLCIIGFNPDGSTTMVILNPVTGAPIVTLNGPYRSLDAEIYQTAAKDPVVEGLSAFGTIAWMHPLSTLLGGTGYSPDDGWDLNSYGTTEIGTFGATSSATDHSYGLDSAKSIGLSIASGALAWTDPGQYQCEGTIQFESSPILCVFSGSLTSPTRKSGSVTRSFKGLHLTLEGINAASGAITWTQPVNNVSAIANGKAEFVDATHLLVQTTNGKNAILDTVTGTTAPVRRGQVLWCTSIAIFKVNENKSVNPAQERVAGNYFFPCKANGQATTQPPPSSPSTVGVTIDGVFLWPTPHGLASRVVGSGGGVA